MGGGYLSSYQIRLIAAKLADQQRKLAEIEARQKADAEAAHQASLSAMPPNLRTIGELRVEIEKKLATGRLKISDAFWDSHIKKLAEQALTGTEWAAEEKIALADMLQEWAGKLMEMEPKDLRKRLKLAALRGQV